MKSYTYTQALNLRAPVGKCWIGIALHLLLCLILMEANNGEK